jgi:two-component system response regulator NreC
MSQLDHRPHGCAERTLTVVIAERHARMRASLRALLEASPCLHVAAEAGDLALMRQHIAGHRPDVLVLDLRMPDGSGIEALRELSSAGRTPGVVVASADDSPAFARRALAAGAAGFVLKDRADVDLPAAVRAAADGERFVSEPLASRLEV